jgi:hypothetical protein
MRAAGRAAGDGDGDGTHSVKSGQASYHPAGTRVDWSPCSCAAIVKEHPAPVLTRVCGYACVGFLLRRRAAAGLAGRQRVRPGAWRQAQGAPAAAGRLESEVRMQLAPRQLRLLASSCACTQLRPPSPPCPTAERCVAPLRRSFKGQSRRDAAWNVAVRLAPCLNWLARYNVKRQLLPDIAAGIAVSFLIVPQGMSYASIAGLPAVYGLYTDFVPLFLYFWFGSSQYLQVGAVAVVSLLTNNTVRCATRPAAGDCQPRCLTPTSFTRSKLVAGQASAVGALSAAAKAAAALAKAAPGNSTLAAMSTAATATYNTGSANLIQLQVQYSSLLAFYVGIFSFFIGFFKCGFVMNLMGPAVISGFQSAVSITIALGQFKNTFGYGKDFTSSTKLDQMIQSYIDNKGNVSLTSVWTGWLWIAILLVFKYLGRVDSIQVRGVRVMRVFKITGPIAVCIIAILATRFGELYLSPGCTGYDKVKGVANVFVPNSPASAWNISYKPVTTTDFLGRLVTYTPPADNPFCVPMPKQNLTGAVVPYPWPKWRGLQITGSFGGPPTGKTPNYGLVNGEVLTGAIIITLVASLESIAIAKALASKHKQPDLDPSREYMALVRGPRHALPPLCSPIHACAGSCKFLRLLHPDVSHLRLLQPDGPQRRGGRHQPGGGARGCRACGGHHQGCVGAHDRKRRPPQAH